MGYATVVVRGMLAGGVRPLLAAGLLVVLAGGVHACALEGAPEPRSCSGERCPREGVGPRSSVGPPVEGDAAPPGASAAPPDDTDDRVVTVPMDAGTLGPPDTGETAAPELPPGAECYELRAHARPESGDTEPWQVLNGTIDGYLNFTFMPPWVGDAYGFRFRPLITDGRVVHHWLLYHNLTLVVDGALLPSSGQHPDAELLAGYAPGAGTVELPDDVAMLLPAGRGFTLELHYNNLTGETVADSSGVEVCVVMEPRPNIAAIHWLGTEAIAAPLGGDISGTCSPNYSQGPITILSSWPHMHQQGRHMKSVIRRFGSPDRTLVDEPFDFAYQVSYDTPAVLTPGDTITTTCSYGGPAVFGPSTIMEMCYNFVLAYPAGMLRSVSGVSANQNQCFL